MDGELPPDPPPLAESIDTVNKSIDAHNNSLLSTPKETHETDVQDTTPSRIKRILPRSPSSPRNNSELTPSRRDYRVLYEELKRKTLEYSKNMEARLDSNQRDLNNQIERMKKEHEAEIMKLKTECENTISSKEQVLKEKTAELDGLKAAEELR